MLRQLGWFFLLSTALALSACNANNDVEFPSTPEADSGVIETEADREGAAVVRDDEREALAIEEQVRLKLGEGITVDENGRATLRLEDLLTADLFRGGEIKLEGITADEETTAITLRQTGGMLLNEFNPNNESDHRLTIETGFATVTTGSARFMIVREANSPLEWIVNLGDDDGDTSSQRSADQPLDVTAAGNTQTIRQGTARWVAPNNAPSQSIRIDEKRLRAWINTVQSGEAQLGLGEVILGPANTIGQAGTLTALPRPGQTFELEANEQGSVALTLDPVGLFGDPTYSLEDCNGDGSQDIAMQAGRLHFDFRPMLARALALDVTVVNRDQSGHGALWGLDPAGDEIDRVLLQVGSNQSQTLTLRSGRPYHRATLALLDGCFIGFSLTPPDRAGQPTAPQAAATAAPQGDVVVNILEEPEEDRSLASDELEASPVNLDDERLTVAIDGELDDWSAIIEASGLDWTGFESITFDQGCATRYPDQESATDLAAQVRFAYDADNLYVAFQVDDDGYVAYSGDDQTYFLGDSPQLSLDMDLLADFGEASRSADDWQVDFLPDLRSPEVVLWQLGSLTARSFDEASVAVGPTETGYFLEAALPWASFGTTPQPGDRLGLAANVNDNDTPETNAQECIISTAPDREWNIPTSWGTLLLRPESQ